MAELAWGASTHPGQIRADNEDQMFAAKGVYVVADGMGGHDAGEVASALAVDRVRQALTDETTSPTAQRVVEAITDANGDIFRAAIATPGQAGMGTTITVIAVIEDPLAGRGEPNIDDNDGIELGSDGEPRVTPVVPRDHPEALVLANVGDSRTYLYRHSRLRRITVDHSYVQELVSTGHITDDEARTHPRRNIITRALGIEPDVKVDWWTLPIVRGDRFLLCSDGLVDEISDEAITATLASEPDPQKAVDSLIEQANEAGGRDNITVIIVDVLEGDDPPDPTQEIDLTPTWADDPTAESIAETPKARRKRLRDRHADTAEEITPAVLTPATALTSDIDTTIDAAVAAPSQSSPAPRPKLKRAISSFVVLALLMAGFVALAAWARRGYFVDFNDSDRVVVYQGRPGGLLWFEPTTKAQSIDRSELTDDAIADVEATPEFAEFDEAAKFVSELDLLEPDATDPDATEPDSTQPDTTGPASSEPESDDATEKDADDQPTTASTAAP